MVNKIPRAAVAAFRTVFRSAGSGRWIRNSGADEVIIPEYEGGLMTGRMIQKYYPEQSSLE